MELTVNGSQVFTEQGVDVNALLKQLDLPDEGVAVAIDGMVRPQVRWAEPIPPFSVVDVLTAVQGG